MPVAVYWVVVPLAIDEPAGVTWMEASVAVVTVRPVEPETLPEVAVMVADPTLAPVARPWEPAVLEIVANEGEDDDQVTEVVMSLKVLSLYMPVAANCSVVPLAIDGPAGVTWIEVRVTAAQVRPSPM